MAKDHSHGQANTCEHKDISYCKTCQRPYCKSCGMEWYPYTCYYYPQYYPNFEPYKISYGGCKTITQPEVTWTGASTCHHEVKQ
jgi:hypothetical protein